MFDKTVPIEMAYIPGRVPEPYDESNIFWPEPKPVGSSYFGFSEEEKEQLKKKYPNVWFQMESEIDI